MIEQLEKVHIKVLEPADKAVVAKDLAQQLGVPENMVPTYLSALYKALGYGDQTQRAIDYLTYKIETKKGLGEI
ncbi:hypothetical protein HYU95_02375 [Candidatus Daviesbacteria bacterium]|nr:hypothetical protein [Candidatus Daviesbacteria bacterium]